MIHGPLSLEKQPEEGHEADVSGRRSGGGLRWMGGGGGGGGGGEAARQRGAALTAEGLVLGGQHKGLRDDVEVLEAVRLLHALDVLVQAVLARQLVGPETQPGPRACQFKNRKTWAYTT